MAVKVEREKWILYKHTNSYEMIKAVAMDVKNQCGTNISMIERKRMQGRLAALDLYKARNPNKKTLDSMNHRINTLEFYMFGYETRVLGNRRFIFSPLGNLFLTYIDDEEKLKMIFATMLFAVQFEHYANGTPVSIQLFPFRLIFTLLLDERLDCKLYFSEYAYYIAGLHSITPAMYEKLVMDILGFRQLKEEDVVSLMKEDEHYYVNCVYEWQYYTTTLLEQAGILDRYEGKEICRLYHPQKTNTKSNPTGRKLSDGFVSITPNVAWYIRKLLCEYDCYAHPIRLNDPERMRMDIVKEIYSFYPSILLDAIGERDDTQLKLLQLPKLIEKYSNNEGGGTAYKFEDVLEDGFNMFWDVKAKKIGGAGHTDIECLYIKKKKKFAVEAKSTKNKLGLISVH